MKKVIFILLLLLILVINLSFCTAESALAGMEAIVSKGEPYGRAEPDMEGINTAPPEINAKAYILIDSDSGQVLCSKNPDEIVYPASTTKIMTAIIALEKGNPEAKMTASQSAVDDIGKDGMNIGIMAGEEMRMKDLLNALLIVSANETANIIAENISRSLDEFATLMNEKAAELGATATHFDNPCGKHSRNHYTTAGDLAKITRYAMTIPAFKEIVSKEYLQTLPSTNKHDKWPILRTTNKLLWDNNHYQYIYNNEEKIFTVNGVKTGYTDQAGHNLVSAGTNDEGMELISVIMGVTGYDSGKGVFTYSKELLKYGFENFGKFKIADAGKILKTVTVADASDNTRLNLLTSGDVFAILPHDHSKWQIEKKVFINPEIKAPVYQGDKLGRIDYYSNATFLGSNELIASRTVSLNVSKRASSTAGKSANKYHIIVKILSYLLIIPIFFIVLRMTLRRVSRIVRARRRLNQP